MVTINRKSISTSGFDQDVVTTRTSGDQIINFGRLTTTGDLANGIFGGADNVTIRNFGTIETSGLGAAGIYVEGANAHIDNYGSVVTHGGFFGDSDFFSEGIFADGDSFRINNYGSVRVEGEESSGLVGIGDNGVIVNYGRVDSVSGGFVVAVVGAGSRAVNLGRLTVGATGGTGLLERGEGSAAVNWGQILVTAAQSYGMGGRLRDGHVTNDGTIDVAADESFGMLVPGDGHRVINTGNIETQGTFAIGIAAAGGRIATAGEGIGIVSSGYIRTHGNAALGIALGVRDDGFFNAADGTIDNRGIIETRGDAAAGVVLAGNGHHLTNGGQITSSGGAFHSTELGVTLDAAGVLLSGDGAVIENTRTGVIESRSAASPAIELNMVQRDGVTNATTSSLLENDGIIRGASVAVLGGTGRETVINHGQIVGNVALGDGNDTFVFGKGGSLAGELLLGGGDDLVRIEKGSGSMRIADFTRSAASGDVIDVSAFYSSFTDLVAHSGQLGSDTVIGLGRNDQLVLENINLGTLNTDDFQFNPSLLVNTMASFVTSGGSEGATALVDAASRGSMLSQDALHLAAPVV